MRRKLFTKMTAVALAISTLCATPIYADQERYLALGQDLTESQKAKVESLLRVTDEADYQITTVSNEEEYKSLGNYISKDQIGTKALSSAVVTSRGKGEGISVETQNITYCTSDMYKNALITAGVTDVDVKVAGPSPISGTAALVGITKIYSQEIAAKPLNDDKVDAANDELVTTEDLGKSIGKDNASDLIATLKQDAAQMGDHYSRKDISDAIDDFCKQNNIQLTEDEKDKILNLIDKLQATNLDENALKEQAKDIYDNIKGFLSNNENSNGNNPITTLGKAITNFFQNIVNFFSGSNR